MLELSKKNEEELLSSIPVVEGMKLSIKELEDNSITLSAPLHKNFNYEGTAFGGSLNTLCILSAYLMVNHLLKINSVSFKSIVIQDSHIKFLNPVTDDFEAVATSLKVQENLLIKMLKKKSLGRITIQSQIYEVGSKKKSVVFEGRYVVSK